MILNPRPWLCALALVLVAAPAQTAELDKFLPDDTQLVASVNLRQILDSGLAKKFEIAKEVEKNLKDNKEAGEVLKMLGLDPMKDVTRITIATPAKPDPKQVLVAVHGSFDLAKIHDAADKVIKDKPESLSVSKEGTLRLYEVKAPGHDEPAFVCFLNKDVLVASPTKAYVIDAIAKNAGKRDPKFSKGLQALVAKQDPKQSFWFASLATEELKTQLASNPQTKQIAEKLESFSAGVTVANDIKFNVLVQTSEEAAAKDIRQKLEGAKALGILAVSGIEDQPIKDYVPLITDLLNAFQFSQDKGRVIVELTIPATVIDKAAGMIKEQQKK
ncbi:hypothetical protein AYO40_00830 [Planctomycetaceae bacterium SCGC AG-212-D15]|nr:hypothetical protein AYO40_00830 [Planctomycetaceae bacterium SCGC AG-212-D15]